MKKLFIIMMLVLATSCKKSNPTYDASGTFEAVETIVSAEANGVIRQFDVEEGQQLQAGVNIGLIDTVQLYLKKKQLLSQIRTTLSQRPDISRQVAALQTQLTAALKEQKRIAKLVESDAATPKQMDDINAQVEVIRKQIAAQESALGIASNSITEQANPLMVQIEQINDQLKRSYLLNPVNGTVLTKYAEVNEMTAVGKPLYKIADLSTLVLRSYITGNQFATVKINQPVKVLVDAADGGSKTYAGVVEWISSKAEFTPKTIQTKDERANLVYAIKIRVKNDGVLKIGMYADVKF